MYQHRCKYFDFVLRFHVQSIIRIRFNRENMNRKIRMRELLQLEFNEMCLN